MFPHKSNDLTRNAIKSLLLLRPQNTHNTIPLLQRKEKCMNNPTNQKGILTQPIGNETPVRPYSPGHYGS